MRLLISAFIPEQMVLGSVLTDKAWYYLALYAAGIVSAFIGWRQY